MTTGSQDAVLNCQGGQGAVLQCCAGMKLVQPGFQSSVFPWRGAGSGEVTAGRLYCQDQCFDVNSKIIKASMPNSVSYLNELYM